MSKWTLSTVFVALCIMVTANSTLVAQPANDNCAQASVIAIGKGGYAYGTFLSDTVSMALATAEAGEYFFSPAHTKSVWYRFTLTTPRRIHIELGGTQLEDVALNLYRPSSCLPDTSVILATLKGDAGGTLESNSCLALGTYRIQITAPAYVSAQVFVRLTTSCRVDPITAPYDCAEAPYVFNGGQPLPNSFFLPVAPHAIACQSIDDTTEYACLPVSNKNTYRKSLWYVFNAGPHPDLLQVTIKGVASNAPRVGYRLLKGDVRTADPAALEILACGMAIASLDTQRIDLPCTASAGVFNTLQLLLPENYSNSNFRLEMRGRGYPGTGWPNIVQPPTNPQNALGLLPANGSVTLQDGFGCEARMGNHPCPSAHPESGVVRVLKGADSLAFDLATWATFSLDEEANVTFLLDTLGYYVRIFRKPPSGECPDVQKDLLYDFFDKKAKVCLSPGDYAVQILAGVNNPRFKASAANQVPWIYGKLGRSFTLTLQVQSIAERFALRHAADFDAVNQLQPLQSGVMYFSEPAPIPCDSTVLPQEVKCAGTGKAVYREIRIEGEGLLQLINLRTDTAANIRYQLFKADAAALAAAQGAHQGGQTIQGMTDYLGCIDQHDDVFSTSIPGLDTFCTCVAGPAVFTLTSLGGSLNVGATDQPKFRFTALKTKYNRREHAETLVVTVPGSVTSDKDVFSCEDNIGNLPACGNAKKVIFRQFYLPEPAVVEIRNIEGGSFRLFKGKASDTADALIPLGSGCGSLFTFYNDCDPLPPGWYTVVSYGDGPNYTDKRAWTTKGERGNVGYTNYIQITTSAPRTPKYNRPYRAYVAGKTDWQNPPANNPNTSTRRSYTLGTEWFCDPDTPFVGQHLKTTCSPQYDRVAFYTFTLTRKSFVIFSDIPTSCYAQVFPFDVRKDSQLLKTIPPVLPCANYAYPYLQLCDMPPGDYTLVIFAQNSHRGESVAPVLYVDRSEPSRFDDISQAYDFGLLPSGAGWINGRPGDVHPTLPGQPPSRDIFTCATGARPTDPKPSSCIPPLNPRVYSGQEPNFPYLPPTPQEPTWRNIWYTFTVDGPGRVSLQINELLSSGVVPFAFLFESPLPADTPWTQLQQLGNAGLSQDLSFVGENFQDRTCWFLIVPYPESCNAKDSFTWNKIDCGKKRYFLMLTYDPKRCGNFITSNAIVSVSLSFQSANVPPPLYDERPSANVINGFKQATPPYTNRALRRGNTFEGAPVYLACYTAAPSDPPGCNTRYTAWYRFEVGEAGVLDVALKSSYVANPWVANTSELTLWRENSDGTLTKVITGLSQVTGDSAWVSGCVEPGNYYLLIRKCTKLPTADTVLVNQAYTPVLRLNEWPGDFCTNAIPLTVNAPGTYSAPVRVTCHTVGTDVGEHSSRAMGCLLGPDGRKTSWFRISVNAGLKVNLRFTLSEEVGGIDVLPNHIAYRVMAGSCQALTPLICSADGGNVIAQNCLGPGDYFVQVSTPVTAKGELVAGNVYLQVTAQANSDQLCTPFNPALPKANFTPHLGCTEISFSNLSTAGADMEYLWQFPDGTTSTTFEPTWTPPGSGTYAVTLRVTNKVAQASTESTKSFSFSLPFEHYSPPSDTFFCNAASSLTLDATLPGATYQWSNGATQPAITVNAPGIYTVQLSVPVGDTTCTRRDTVEVSLIEAIRRIEGTLCPLDTLYLQGQAFHRGRSSGQVVLPGAHPLGCDSIWVVQLTFRPFASSRSSLSACLGSTMELEAPLGGVGYRWQDGSTVSTFKATATGVYWVETVDDYGCVIRRDSFDVNFAPLPPPKVSPLELCAGTDGVLGASGSTGHYRWYTGPVGGALLGEQAWWQTPVLNRDTVFWVEAYDPEVAGCISQRVPARVEVHPVEESSFEASICAGESYFYGGQWLTVSGRYFDTLQTVFGCDSVVALVLTVRDTAYRKAEVVLCHGESFALPDGRVVEEEGEYAVKLLTQHGCDSTVLFLVSKKILHRRTDSVWVCSGRPYALPWGQSADKPGWYSRVLPYSNGCDSLAWSIHVGLKSPLSVKVSSSDYHAFGVSCAGATDGYLRAVALTGTPPYTAVWSTGGVGLELKDLPAGTYSVTVSDSEGCTGTATATLTEPAPPALRADVVSPLCPGEEKGQIILHASGGVEPYLFALNTGALSPGNRFFGLLPGTYTVLAEDANGCEVEGVAEVEKPLPLSLSLEIDKLRVSLGDSLRPSPVLSFVPDSIGWSPSVGLSCSDCLTPWVKPTKSTIYTLRVWSPEGCLLTARLTVQVARNIRIYAPNAFRPDGSGEDAFFTLYTGPEVTQIKYLAVFDRWGGQVFEARGVPPNAASSGWDGRDTRGMPLAPEVFTWIAVVELLDGQEETLRGDVTLVR